MTADPAGKTMGNMTVILTQTLRSPQGVVMAMALALALFLGALNPAFFSAATLIDITRNGLVTGIFAIGVMLVLCAGGIDVSCTAIGAFAMYATAKLIMAIDPGLSIWAWFAMGALIGALLGLINGILVGGFGLNTLIVTLGTMSLIRGALLTFLGTVYVTNMPREVVSFARSNIVRIENEMGQMVSLPKAFWALAAVSVLVGLILRFTIFGRKVYAIGGSEEGARRLGINVAGVKVAVFVMAGAIAGIAGITHMTLARMANPFDLVGQELNVIAAVVLGGARITGGYGTVVGTMLGVLVITMINTSLLMVGVPSYWQKVVVGALIIIGTALPIAMERWQARSIRSRA
ncbi:ABC transporter permease [Rhodobacter sp. 24-YEA-8]|uniref:ABC transporter permease n=1 Tax=Rhodobacter sp. 24-YEA-8 TaxID=1884310 RepID=UPI0008962F78|nr:ABC transporter permease [Rhodobacter sp. 24-YEA-8]SED75468.1 monosaccharide ABC transporter membrane protein, CUT2 family [Rhodobacter sp. 24-YEA-8]